LQKNLMHSFTGHLITLPLVLTYQKSVPVSQQHQTSCSEMRRQEMGQNVSHTRSWESNYS